MTERKELYHEVTKEEREGGSKATKSLHYSRLSLKAASLK